MMEISLSAKLGGIGLDLCLFSMLLLTNKLRFNGVCHILTKMDSLVKKLNANYVDGRYQLKYGLNARIWFDRWSHMSLARRFYSKAFRDEFHLLPEHSSQMVVDGLR